MSRRRANLIGIICIVLYGAVALAFIARSANGALTMPANSDWVAFAVGSHLIRSGGCLYCVGSQIATTHAMGLAPGDGINPFVSLPPSDSSSSPSGCSRHSRASPFPSASVPRRPPSRLR